MPLRVTSSAVRRAVGEVLACGKKGTEHISQNVCFVSTANKSGHPTAIDERTIFTATKTTANHLSFTLFLEALPYKEMIYYAPALDGTPGHWTEAEVGGRLSPQFLERR
jgi:hypothetical protein